MSVYRCPICNKKYAIDDRTQSSKEFQDTFKCDSCGSGYIEENNDFNNAESNTYDSDNSPMGVAREQLETLKSIERMMKFFYRWAWFSIILGILFFLWNL